MVEIADWIHALRTSHDRFRDLVVALDDKAVDGASFDPGWSIADVASHLGSGAEIFELFLEAGLPGPLIATSTFRSATAGDRNGQECLCE